MQEEIYEDTKQRMQKTIDAFKSNLTKIRTGRASPDILDSITVDYYGNETPLNQLSNISVEDSQTLAISPWEEKFIPEIEQTIVKANIGLNPVTTGNVIRIPLPPLTEERRVELTKQVKIGRATSELQSHHDLVCRLLLEKKKKKKKIKKTKKI